MKLVKNGETGVLVDDQTIDKLTTLKAIDDEIKRIAVGDYKVVKRDNNNVVSADEYSNYLKDLRKTFLEKTKAKIVDSSEKANPSDAKNDMESQLNDMKSQANDMRLQINERDELIGRLLTAAKSATNEVRKLKADKKTPTKEPYLTCQLADDDHATNMKIKGPLGHLIRELSGGHGISMFANIAIARGLFGDERAARISDDLYGKDAFATFIDAVKGDSTANDNNTSAKSESSKPDAK